ncbi:MAG: S-methyl-5-thioribose kinase [Fibrobacteria bacterium]|nr:S-methyl-5-thioribose kinase [Fibrobacteria bacterium]
MAYSSLDESAIVDYVKNVGLYEQDESLTVKEIGDGNINMVFYVKNEKTGKSMIVKQAYPYVRCVGESWPLNQDRIRIEAEAIEKEGELAPGLVPKIYHQDDDMHIMVMEDLSHLGVMRGQMLTMTKFPKFADHISTFLANTLYFTSDIYMNPTDKKELVKSFINPDLCKITEDLIFSDPYYDHERNNINPALKPYLVDVFWKKPELRLEASKFKYKFLTSAESLLHGDLHIGSMFGDSEETKVFDSEFAFVGPMAFDIGLLIGNLLINYVSWSGKTDKFSEEQITDYRDHLETMINDIYNLFEKKFIANWNKKSEDILAEVEGYQQHFMKELFSDTVGFAALVMIRRMHGLAHNADVDDIENEELRKDVQVRMLELAEEMLMNREKYSKIEDITGFIKKNVELNKEAVVA